MILRGFLIALGLGAATAASLGSELGMPSGADATVNGAPILRKDVEALALTLPGSRQQARAQARRMLIDEELLLQRGLALDLLQSDRRLRNLAIQVAAERLASEATSSKVSTARAAAPLVVALTHRAFELPQKDLAQRTAEQLRRGVRLDPGGEDWVGEGPTPLLVAQRRLGEPLASELDRAADGAVIGPRRVGDRLHVIKVRRVGARAGAVTDPALAENWAFEAAMEQARRRRGVVARAVTDADLRAALADGVQLPRTPEF